MEEDRTLAELASEYGVRVKQIAAWKKRPEDSWYGCSRRRAKMVPPRGASILGGNLALSDTFPAGFHRNRGL
jgi:hypothetical protein